MLVKADMSPDRLVLITPEGKECAVWPMAEVERLLRKDGLPLQLVWRVREKSVTARKNGRLLVEDEDAACTLLPYLGSCRDGQRASAIRRWCVIGISVWIAISLIYSFTPLLFQQWAGRIPRDVENSLGASARATIAEVFAHLPGSRGECALREGRPELERLKERLARAMDTEGYVFDIRFLESPMINAYALPGGVILLTTGLLRACASAEELAGVLAVAMAHIIQRHPGELMLREQGWLLLVRWLLDADYSAVASGELVRQALIGAFDPEQEKEAATLAARRLAAAGIRAASAADFFSRLRAMEEVAYGKVRSYAAVRPDLMKQEQILRATAAAQGDEHTPALDAEAWKRLHQGTCQAPAGPAN
ncbi:MAG: M48 family metalloprotease [Deltaproteobacteria bacterium]|nr:M48 family metalloprotease [Deltaproteobacteria bacterium]